jgi:hypothetical protein
VVGVGKSEPEEEEGESFSFPARGEDMTGDDACVGQLIGTFADFCVHTGRVVSLKLKGLVTQSKKLAD